MEQLQLLIDSINEQLDHTLDLKQKLNQSMWIACSYPHADFDQFIAAVLAVYQTGTNNEQQILKPHIEMLQAISEFLKDPVNKGPIDFSKMSIPNYPLDLYAMWYNTKDAYYASAQQRH